MPRLVDEVNESVLIKECSRAEKLYSLLYVSTLPNHLNQHTLAVSYDASLFYSPGFCRLAVFGLGFASH